MTTATIRTFLPGGAHTGSSGFTNYMGPAPTTAAVFAEFPKAVIVDGSDDWSAKVEYRPQRLCKTWKITPLAYYHSGISGIARSGVVLSQTDFRRFRTEYQAAFNADPSAKLRVIKPPRRKP